MTERPHPAPLTGRQLLLAALACLGVTLLLAALACEANAQDRSGFEPRPPWMVAPEVWGTRGTGRVAIGFVPWPTYQTTYLPCLQNDPACLAEGPRWIPTKDEVDTVRTLVVAYFRMAVNRGALRQDVADPCWEGWTPEQRAATGCEQSRAWEWDAIRPTIEFSSCFFSVPGATDGSGRPPATFCAAGTANGTTGVVTVSIAERDRTLALVAWEVGNYVTARARLWDPAARAPLADGPFISRATNFAMEALR